MLISQIFQNDSDLLYQSEYHTRHSLSEVLIEPKLEQKKPAFCSAYKQTWLAPRNNFIMIVTQIVPLFNLMHVMCIHQPSKEKRVFYLGVWHKIKTKIPTMSKKRRKKIGTKINSNAICGVIDYFRKRKSSPRAKNEVQTFFLYNLFDKTALFMCPSV